jgi:hypothetical protein
MNPRPAVGRGSALRAVLHLAAVLSMVAALGLVTAQTADAATSTSSKSKSASTTHKSSTAHSASTEKVDINSANLKELEGLPGIGTVMGQKIIAGRPYKSIADLKHAGIPPNTIKGLSGKVKAGRSSASKTEGAPRAAAEPAPEKQPEAASSREASEPAKPAPQKTFFGIPIGAPARTTAKEEPAPAASEGASAREAAPRPAVAERAPIEEPPAKGMVWVNLDTKVYHVEGDRWYGATKHGKYMWEDQAIRDGYRVSKSGPKNKE